MGTTTIESQLKGVMKNPEEELTLLKVDKLIWFRV